MTLCIMSILFKDETVLSFVGLMGVALQKLEGYRLDEIIQIVITQRTVE